VVPFDPVLFATAANNGQMVGELNAQARASQCFKDLAQRLTGRAPKAETKQGRGLNFDFLKRRKAG
jgi:pilus assembly protein CpaE